MSHFLAVDAGGTQLRAACYTRDDHSPIAIKKIATHAGETQPTERLLGLIESVWPKTESVTAIGLAVPGAVNPFDGIVYISPNIKGWVNIPLKKIVQERFGVPTAIGNDANLAALGEWKYGAGQGHRNMLYFTISTGVGGGIIIDNRLLLGERGLAAEVGHITVDPEGAMCGCGKRGHLEAIVSGPAIARWVSEQIKNGVASSLPGDKNLSGKDIAEAAVKGDLLAISAFERAGFWFGRTLADFLHLYNPTAVIIGGGVSQSGNLLFKPLKASLEKHALSPMYYNDLIIKTAQLGDNAGLTGALLLAQALVVG
jgi:glucokinase